MARQPNNPNAPYYVQLREFKQRLLEGAIEASDGNIALAAQRLGLPEATMKKLCREFGIKSTYAPYVDRVRKKAPEAEVSEEPSNEISEAVEEAVEEFENDGLFLMADDDDDDDDDDEDEDDDEDLDEDEDEDDEDDSTSDEDADEPEAN